MPFPLLAALLISGAASAGSSIYGAKKAGDANKRATDLQAKSDAEAMAFERQRYEDEKKYRDTLMAFERERYGSDREDTRFNQAQTLFNRGLVEAREQRLVPYREAGVDSLTRLSDLLGPGQMRWRSPSNMGRVSLSDLAR